MCQPYPMHMSEAICNMMALVFLSPYRYTFVYCPPLCITILWALIELCSMLSTTRF